MNNELGTYRIYDATLYFLGNGVDPRNIDRETLIATDQELKQNPCIIEPLGIPSSVAPQETTIPQNGRARELLDDLFGKRGITPEEDPPEILRVATRMVIGIIQSEAMQNIPLIVSPETYINEQPMNGGTEYNL